MRLKFREVDESKVLARQIRELRVEKERLEAELDAPPRAESPKTMTWFQAGKHTLRLSVLGFIILGLQHQYNLLGDWLTGPNMAPMFMIFITFFGESGTGLDWRGRGRLLCSYACIVSLITLFNQFVMGVSASETRNWMPLILAINLMVWLLHDGLAKLVKR